MIHIRQVITSNKTRFGRKWVYLFYYTVYQKTCLFGLYWVIAIIISHTKLTFAPTIFRQIVLKVYRGYRINFITDRSVKEKLNKGTIATTLNLGEHQRSTSSILKMWTNKLRTIGQYLHSPDNLKCRRKFCNLCLIITENNYFLDTILEFIQVKKCYLKESLVTDVKY